MYSRQTHTHNMTNTSKFDVLSNEYFFCLIRHLQPSNFNYATDHNWKICKSTGFFPNDYSITKFSLMWQLIGVFFYVMSNKQPHSIQSLVWSVVSGDTYPAYCWCPACWSWWSWLGCTCSWGVRLGRPGDKSGPLKNTQNK